MGMMMMMIGLLIRRGVSRRVVESRFGLGCQFEVLVGLV